MTRKLIAACLVPIILLFAAPALFGHHVTYIISLCMVYSILALSLNLVLGYMGKLSFVHGALFGLGAFGEAYLLEFVPFPLALLGGTAIAALVAALLGIVCARLKSIYFAMLTLGAGEVVYFLILQWVSVGGQYGLHVPPLKPLEIFGLSIMNLGPFNNYYFFVVIMFLILTWLMYRITGSPFGHMVRAIRENVDRVEFVGVNEKRLEWTNFVISGAFAGIAGGLFAPLTGYLAAEIVGFAASAEVVIMVILGGPYVFVGPVIGAFLLVFIEEYLAILTMRWLLFLGILLFVFIYFLPGGIAGYIQSRVAKGAPGS
jgi:branched-chain amino acid transport system permease protein